jgi:DNA-binding CsgD family transcriptional regulator
MRRPRGRPPHPDVLTPAEWQVLDWMRHGVSRAEIARRRGTSVDAVKYHLANISGKLGVRGRALRDWPGVPITSNLSTRRSDSSMSSAATRLGAIGQVSLSIRDVARAERFYGETLGLPHVFTFGDLAFFDAGGVRLYLHRKDEAEWRPSSVLRSARWWRRASASKASSRRPASCSCWAGWALPACSAASGLDG